MKKTIILILLACIMVFSSACGDTNQASKKAEPNKQEQKANAEEKRLKEARKYFHEVSPNCEILEILFTDVPGAHTIIAYRDNNEDPGEDGNDRVTVDFVDKDGSSAGIVIGEKNLVFRKSGKKLGVVDKETVRVNYFDTKDKKNKYTTFRFSRDSKKKATKFVTNDFIE